MNVTQLDEHKHRRLSASMRAAQHAVGQEGFTDAEIVGGAFCDGIGAGVPAWKLHEAYMNSSSPMDFEVRVWVEIELFRPLIQKGIKP